MLSVRAVQQFFDKLHALEIQELRVLFLAPVERHAHLPRAREDVRIFDSCFVRDHIRAGARVALHHVQLVAMEISGAIKPCLIVQVGYVDHQGVALPASDGLAHPRVCRSGSGVFQKNVPHGAGVLVNERERAGALQNLERVGHVGGARHPGEIAFDLRIPL